MGKAQEGRIDSDYSGRPLRRPTREEVEAAEMSPGTGSYIGCDLPDGRHALVGPGGIYHEHFVNGVQIWDRPVDLSEFDLPDIDPNSAARR